MFRFTPRLWLLRMDCVTLKLRSFEYQLFMMALKPSSVPALGLSRSRSES